MARKASPTPGRPAVSHKSIYDALKIEGEDDSSDEEVEATSSEEGEEAAPTTTAQHVFDAVSQKVSEGVELAKGAADEAVKAITSGESSVLTPAVAAVVGGATPGSRRAEKKAARQAALKAAGLSPSPSPPPGTVDVNLANASHADPPVAALAASTPEVEALKEMGVANDGSGPGSGVEPTEESKEMTGMDQQDVKDVREAKIDRGLLDEQMAPSTKKDDKTTGGGLPHPFSPSNLPSLPALPQPASKIPSKRGPSPDFAASEKKEKKAVRFDASTDSGGLVAPEGGAKASSTSLSEAELAKQKRMKDAGTRTASTLAMIAGFFGALRSPFNSWHWTLILTNRSSLLRQASSSSDTPT